MSASSTSSWRTVWRRALLPAATALAAALAAPAGAAGEELHPSQARELGAQDAMWAPAAARPAAICIVDTGVDLNPDTAGIIERLAVDGGDGGDVSSGRHGTLMAMVAGAPANGWGMVGLAPGQPIVSVRAKRPGTSYFFFDDVQTAIWTCRAHAERYNIRVVSLSISGRSVYESTALAVLRDAIDAVRQRGISVVAAAGNDPGPVEWPAAYPPVLSVGAAAGDGTACPFAAGPADIAASGCPVDVAMPDTGAPAWASGSSESTALVAAALAQLYSHRPELTPDEAEQLLVRTARQTGGVPMLDVVAAWTAAGLQPQLAAGAAARPPEPPPSSAGDGGAPPAAPAPPPTATTTPGYVAIAPPSITVRPTRARWPAPRVRSVRYRRGVVKITVRRLPRGARLVARFTGRAQRGEFARWQRTLTSRTRTLRGRVPAWLRAAVTIEGGGRGASQAVNIRPR